MNDTFCFLFVLMANVQGSLFLFEFIDPLTVSVRKQGSWPKSIMIIIFTKVKILTLFFTVAVIELILFLHSAFLHFA